MKISPWFKLAVVSACFMLGATTDAATLTRTQTTTGQEFNTALTFNQFDTVNEDPAFIAMNSITVQLIVEVITSSFLGLDNEGGGPADVDATVEIDGSITSTDVTLPAGVTTFHTRTESFTLGADDGDNPNFFDVGGPDFDTMNGPTGTQNDSGIVDISNFSQYLGSGTFDINSIIDQTDIVNTVGAVSKSFSPSSVRTTVIITYDYSAIPEPATLSFFVVGVSIMAWIRRRNRVIQE